MSQRKVGANGTASYGQSQSEWRCGLCLGVKLTTRCIKHSEPGCCQRVGGPSSVVFCSICLNSSVSPMNSKKKEWFTKVKNSVSSSPVASNVAFGFILVALEKLVELEFECPCIPAWNTAFSVALFIIPGLLACLMMLIVQECRCNATCRETFSISALVPLIEWVSLLFMDGRYLACAATDWNGTYVHIDKAEPQKWCEPIKAGNSTTQEKVLQSKQLFVLSQVIGMIFFSAICIGLVVYLVIKSYTEQKQKQQTVEERVELTTFNSERSPERQEETDLVPQTEDDEQT
ncbi:calcium homeostasis modulator protein 6-like [Fundulus heteroclitus]|uniref:calcium homeostasis modulator protein 6-like n=1 Tax=Fundulus heteroclitus TaxID=8078 RepID=UPI00165BA0D8|nr:calcium homeostasis modulator protein 6-like [Fundulus heteroclitus]